MRRFFVIPAIAAVLLLSGTIAAGAATSAAQIVSCPGTTWCFTPNPITVTAGSSVTWTNSTGVTHTATANNGAWTTGNIASGSTGGPVTFNAAGTFAYHCAIHPFMTGSIVVTAAIAPSAAPAPTAAPVVVKRLAAGGGGPGLVAAALLGLGLALLRPGWSRRRRPGR